ncbi:MAG: hypothetical protein JNL64_00775 [Blastocatellia bacterium]|jgi:hypothetical protein|nr:hypothetical protein [Blastocatellia bacterium]
MATKNNSHRRKERRSRIAMIDDPAKSKLTAMQLLFAFAILLLLVSLGVRLLAS